MSIRRSQEMFKSNFAITNLKPIQLLGSWSLGAFLICFFRSDEDMNKVGKPFWTIFSGVWGVGVLNLPLSP